MYTTRLAVPKLIVPALLLVCGALLINGAIEAHNASRQTRSLMVHAQRGSSIDFRSTVTPIASFSAPISGLDWTVAVDVPASNYQVPLESAVIREVEAGIGVLAIIVAIALASGASNRYLAYLGAGHGAHSNS